MKRFLFTGIMGVAMMVAAAPKAEAALILAFGQGVAGNTITGTAVAGVTTIVGTNVVIGITFIENGAPTAAFLNLNATSTNIATNPSGDLLQNYTGNFCITSAVNCGGTNYLTSVGNFVDLTSGAVGGSQLNMGASQPPDTVNFNSAIITSLGLGRALSLSFTNVTPAVNITGGTLGSFTAAISGNFSGNIPLTQVPEPGSMLLLGSGLLGLAAFARRRAGRKS